MRIASLVKKGKTSFRHIRRVLSYPDMADVLVFVEYWNIIAYAIRSLILSSYILISHILHLKICFPFVPLVVHRLSKSHTRPSASSNLFVKTPLSWSVPWHSQFLGWTRCCQSKVLPLLCRGYFRGRQAQTSLHIKNTSLNLSADALFLSALGATHHQTGRGGAFCVGGTCNLYDQLFLQPRALRNSRLIIHFYDPRLYRCFWGSFALMQGNLEDHTSIALTRCSSFQLLCGVDTNLSCMSSWNQIFGNAIDIKALGLNNMCCRGMSSLDTW